MLSVVHANPSEAGLSPGQSTVNALAAVDIFNLQADPDSTFKKLLIWGREMRMVKSVCSLKNYIKKW